MVKNIEALAVEPNFAHVVMDFKKLPAGFSRNCRSQKSVLEREGKQPKPGIEAYTRLY